MPFDVLGCTRVTMKCTLGSISVEVVFDGGVGFGLAQVGLKLIHHGQ